MTEQSSHQILDNLYRAIKSRKGGDAKKSHTAKLFKKGRTKICKKFGEEAVEAVIAAALGDKDSLTAEAADVLYHLLVMLTSRGITFTDVLAELTRREGVSGHEEKAAR